MHARKCADREAGVNFSRGRSALFRDMYRVQQHLLVGSEGYAKQNSAGICTSLPNVFLDGLSRSGVILALKDVATFEGEDKLMPRSAACGQ